MRSKETIEAFGEEHEPASEQAGKQESPAARIKPWQWKKGQSGNPGGRPKRDVSAEIARAVFEQNPEMAYKAMAKGLAKGSGFVFQVLSDRAYGKLTDKVHVSGEISLAERIERARKKVAEKNKP